MLQGDDEAAFYPKLDLANVTQILVFLNIDIFQIKFWINSCLMGHQVPPPHHHKTMTYIHIYYYRPDD